MGSQPFGFHHIFISYGRKTADSINSSHANDVLRDNHTEKKKRKILIIVSLHDFFKSKQSFDPQEQELFESKTPPSSHKIFV